jgi:cysteine synthase A
MANIYHSVTELVGKTPLLSLDRYIKLRGIPATLLAKLECFNPAGSVKDRAALFMLEDARQRGILTSNSVIIEPTSGNTGIGLCALAASMGLRCIIVMPDTMSVERQLLMKAYGAEVILSPGAQGMTGAIAMAQTLAASTPNAFIPDQFCNPANAAAHFATTGPEIWSDTDGKVDIFVAGIGTGGTVTGTGKYLKSQNSSIQVVGVEPASSPVLSGGQAGKHGIQGIGAGFVPDILDAGILDEILPIEDKDAFAAAKEMAQKAGILVGISSGAALHAAKVLATRPENAGKTIVALLPDSGERYLSTGLFD